MEIKRSTPFQLCFAFAETTPSVRVVAEGTSTPDSATHLCSDTDRIDSNAGMANANRGFSRYTVMKRRTEWARSYWQDALKVQRAVAPIALSSSVQNAFPQATTLAYPGADLVVIMTARPSPNLPIAGFALCLQYNAFDRCEVGHFNWVPDVSPPAPPPHPPAPTHFSTDLRS